eukprot:scaffold4325_cov53-Cylindrotheca_fusiformis.AAC.2
MRALDLLCSEAPTPQPGLSSAKVLLENYVHGTLFALVVVLGTDGSHWIISSSMFGGGPLRSAEFMDNVCLWEYIL